MENNNIYEQGRAFLKSIPPAEGTDQEQNLPQPPYQKYCGGAKTVKLERDYEAAIKKNDILSVLNERRSRRLFSGEPMTLCELSFLLWATQGVREVIGKKRFATMRLVPSAGARHPFETYVFVNRVTGLDSGHYHYMATEHKLEYLHLVPELADRLTEAMRGQSFVGTAAVNFVWTAIPYRTEWRYGSKKHKYIMADAGHVCENLYIAAEAAGLGACAIGAYDQQLIDSLLGLPESFPDFKEEEFAVYMAAVGKPSETR